MFFTRYFCNIIILATSPCRRSLNVYATRQILCLMDLCGFMLAGGFCGARGYRSADCICVLVFQKMFSKNIKWWQLEQRIWCRTKGMSKSTVYDTDAPQIPWFYGALSKFLTGIKRKIPHVLLLIELKCQYTSSPMLESALWLDCSNAKTNSLCLHLAVNTALNVERGAGCSMAGTALAACGESAGDLSNVSCSGLKEKLIWGSAVLTLGSDQLHP